MSAILCLFALAFFAEAQKIGTHVSEAHPEMPLWLCSSSGCIKEMKSIVLDSNWRWVHNGQYTNCYKDGAWNPTLCPDGKTCAENCYLDGAGLPQYADTYGIHTVTDGIKVDFVTKSPQGGSNFGSRVYLMNTKQEYEIFKLKNREFSVTVDDARMPCGLNGAIYFVEMDADGGVAASGGTNEAGAEYGTGYCDAQCPHDMKFINGIANSEGWNASADPPIGKYGACCAEMDIWEANSRATAYTPHPCNITGLAKCEGVQCGDNTAGQRYDGVCDKDGCDFNPYRMGNETFYGRHGGFTVDSTKELTVVTQFLTSDGTDSGDLVEIRQFYVQDGNVIPHSYSSISDVKGNSITDDFCSEMKTAFGDINDFARKGGLKAMGEAMDRGLVLVMSLWDDSLANMLWLDSDYPTDVPPSTPGVKRGPCLTTTGTPAYVRQKYPTASVEYTNLKVGPINSTVTTSATAADEEFGDDRRLQETFHV
mmetsp:Transcript_25948/g.46905  ORF Transcript_25948/g.46905 Transcript_25948/m.46905 type:complete len:480 (+) Transcript_25948:54-1493(+)